jgi:hypothetical protein
MPPRRLPRIRTRGGSSSVPVVTPYIPEAEEKETRRRNLLQPIEVLFDILDRPGQAVRGAVAEAFQGGTLASAVQAGSEGLRGKRDTQSTDIMQNLGWKPRGGIEKVAQKVAGFFVDVLLDPLTYVGLGPTKGAKFAAKAFAQESTEQAFRRGGSQLGRLTAKVAEAGFDPAAYGALRGAGKTGRARQYANRFGADLAREMDTFYTAAYREGLRTTPEAATGQFLRGLGDEGAQVRAAALEKVPVARQATQIKNLQRQLGKVDPADAKNIEKFTRRLEKAESPQRVEDLRAQLTTLLDTGEGPRGLQRAAKKPIAQLANIEEASIAAPERFAREFRGMGERGVSILGKEVGVSARQPNFVARQWEEIRGAIERIPAPQRWGGNVATAWWGVMNTGPVGVLRKAFGFRNPYQRMLRFREMDTQHGFRDGIARQVQEIGDAVGTVDLPTQEAYVRMKAEADRLGPDFTFEQVLSMPEAQAAAGLAGDQAVTAALLQMDQAIAPYLRRMATEMDAWHAGGYVASMNVIEHYLPIQAQLAGTFKKGKARGSAKPGYSLTRQFGFSEHADQQTSKIRFLFGVDEATARDMVAANTSILTTDLKEMLVTRAVAQERVRMRVNMIDSFKEFGIHINEMMPGAALGKTDIFGGNVSVAEMAKKRFHDMLNTQGQTLEQLGLKSIGKETRALKGIYFDSDVFEIFDRAAKSTATDASIAGIRNMLQRYTSLWKSVVTTSGGFHFRNMVSNNITGFLLHGFNWFNVKKYNYPAMVGTLYGLKDSSQVAKKAWAALNSTMGEQKVTQTLSRMYGGRSLRDNVDYALRKGVLTRQFGRFEEDSVKLILGAAVGKRASPFSTDFLPYELSRQFGSLVEGTPRLQSFLMGIDRSAGKGLASGAMLEGAKQDTLTWFYDYEDLTDLERGIRSYAIPFYTWLRKNVARQISGIIEHPEMYAVLPKFHAALESEDAGLSRQDIPDYLVNEGAIPIGPIRLLGQQIAQGVFRPDFAYMDLNIIPMVFERPDAEFVPPKEGPLGVMQQQLGLPSLQLSFEEMQDDIVNSAHPLIKSAVQWSTRRDLFRKKDLGAQGPAPRMFRFLTNNATEHADDGKSVLGWLDGFLRQMGKENGLHLGIDNRGRLEMDSRIAMVLDTNLPILRQMAVWLDLPTEIASAMGLPLEEIFRQFTGAQSDYPEQLGSALQVLSTTFGIKLREVDEQREQYNRAGVIYRAALDSRKEDISGDAGSQQRRDQSRRSQRSLYERLNILERR